MKLSTQFVEALKEFLRTVVLGLVPALVASLGIIWNGIDTDAGTFDIAWNLVAAVFAANAIVVFQTSLMSALDKFLHKNKIETPLDFKSLDALKK